MKITNRTSLLGFILALSTLDSSNALASSNRNPQTIENRISSLSEILKQKESQALDTNPNITTSPDLLSWGNFRNTAGPGGAAGFANANPRSNWANGFRDAGGFANFRNL